MQQSLGESMATHRQGVDETIVKFESFKTSITRAASAEHETMKKQFGTTHHAVRQLQEKNNVDNEQIHKQFERAEAEIPQLQNKNAKWDKQVNTLSKKVVRLEHELQRLQVRVQDIEHAHHQRELQVDQLLAHVTGQGEGLQGTVSQGPPQDPSGPPGVPQTTATRCKKRCWMHSKPCWWRNRHKMPQRLHNIYHSKLALLCSSYGWRSKKYAALAPRFLMRYNAWSRLPGLPMPPLQQRSLQHRAHLMAPSTPGVTRGCTVQKKEQI